ncbi:proline-rich protein PRCC [Epargyreus clarus]|uniref:proline-rich protein PRCC n=1 Tax=Epargyreus clarus TaxID=520877 RepID=UPI003C2B9EB0
MALVAYDNSDSSDYEEDDNVSTPVITLHEKKEEPIIQIKNSAEVIQNGEEQSEQGQNLFNHLPLPTHKKTRVVEEDDEFLHKKETVSDVKPKSKITVPSLNDFKDVKDTIPNAKPKVINGKKSGLLSILPQPKNACISTTKSLIPHVLTQKPISTTVKKKNPLPSPSKKSKSETPLISQYSDESDNDDDVQNDFFSIYKPVEVPLEELPLDIDQPSNSKDKKAPAPSKPRGIESYFKQDPVQELPEEVHDVEEGNVAYNQESGQSSDYTVPSQSAVLDEEAILKLCGSRGKRKREDIQIVDVNQQEVLADAREWLLKGLMDDTSKRISASKKRGNEPTSQQKRKHQITYLAHQAKANEIELQNQWANNRMTKRQTQSKYGF